MKYQVRYSKTFKKGLKKFKNNKEILEYTKAVILKLANDETLEPNYKDHKLSGEYEGFRECHILPNLLLIYQKQESLLILSCIALGSHSEIF